MSLSLVKLGDNALDCGVTADNWGKAVDILQDKPQSVDKRFGGQVWLGGCASKLQPTDNLAAALGTVGAITWERVLDAINQHGRESQSDCSYTLQKLVPRREKSMAVEFRLVARTEFQAVFLPVCDSLDNLKSRAYSTRWDPDCKQVEVCAAHGCSDQQSQWLRDRLLSRLSNWLQDDLNPTVNSLRLVNIDTYYSTYNRLKEKYAPDLISNWQESSDPEKNVHEDLGIAAYLACLWADKKVTFVDLGCGNGLLVYILTSEGHKGIGYDLRRRKIWDWYPGLSPGALVEEAVLPSMSTKFPDVDWILGNHSDELTPWIPVIACLSGPMTRYWILPCCPHDFHAKYQRQNANKSVFRDYIDHVTNIGSSLGFSVAEDRMRIPSTKRICLVGTPSERLAYEDRCSLVPRLVQPKTSAYQATSIEFQPRAKVEKVRNCTQVDRSLVASIVDIVVQLCLRQRSDIVTDSGRRWNAGTRRTLEEVVQELQKADISLRQLKSECGGVQTLLKNHHNIFVVRQGCVSIRVPGDSNGQRPRLSATAEASRRKTKSCWHHHKHPDGCPLADSDCNWVH